MAKRHFLMQAHKMKPDFDPRGFYVSEKFDGIQAAWDGGVTCGMDCRDIPFANVAKHGRYKVRPKATGLWSRYAQPIQAPEWFTRGLPTCPLVGELWAGFGNQQLVTSFCGKLNPIYDEWKQIKYMIFDSQPISIWLAAGKIDLQHLKMTIPPGVERWFMKRVKNKKHLGMREPFFRVQAFLQSRWFEFPHQCLVEQFHVETLEQYQEFHRKVLEKGGEGTILRGPASRWQPIRSHGCIKDKPYEDDEAFILDFVAGAIGKEGRTRGKLGAILVQYGDVRFKIGNGFTKAQRVLKDLYSPDDNSGAFEWAWNHPEELIPKSIEPVGLSRYDEITFRYRELSDDGVPKEARFLRKRVRL